MPNWYNRNSFASSTISVTFINQYF